MWVDEKRFQCEQKLRYYKAPGNQNSEGRSPCSGKTNGLRVTHHHQPSWLWERSLWTAGDGYDINGCVDRYDSIGCVDGYYITQAV